MNGSKMKEKILRNIDINQYILDHVKRKLLPLAISNKKKLKVNFQAQPTNFKQQVSDKLTIAKNQTRNSQFCLTERSVKKEIRNKMKSQIQKSNQQFSFEKGHPAQFSLDTRLRNVSNRALQYIQLQRIKNKSDLNRMNQQFCFSPSHPQHHKRIITSLLKPFDFGNIPNSAKKKEFSLNSPSSNFSFNKKIDLVQKPKQDGFQKQSNKQILKDGSVNDDGKDGVQKGESTTKEIGQEKVQDKIDLQFEQGLVEEIYDTKRVKIRKKINNIRSKNNIIDGRLYFLKE